MLNKSVILYTVIETVHVSHDVTNLISWTRQSDCFQLKLLFCDMIKLTWRLEAAWTTLSITSVSFFPVVSQSHVCSVVNFTFCFEWNNDDPYMVNFLSLCLQGCNSIWSRLKFIRMFNFCRIREMIKGSTPGNSKLLLKRKFKNSINFFHR